MALNGIISTDNYYFLLKGFSISLLFVFPFPLFTILFLVVFSFCFLFSTFSFLFVATFLLPFISNLFLIQRKNSDKPKYLFRTNHLKKELNKYKQLERGRRQECIFSLDLWNHYSKAILREVDTLAEFILGGHSINDTQYPVDAMSISDTKRNGMNK